MSHTFKTLASICVWVLFLHGLVAILWGGVDMFIFTGGWKLTYKAAISCSIGTANLILAVLAARLRQKMDQ
jgi:hypothetical protein